MPEYDYYVVIRKTGTGKDTEITGSLTCIICEYDTSSDFPFIPKEENFPLEFNPLTILGDLRNREKPFKYSNERLNIDRSWKYLSSSYEYGLGKPLYIGNDEQYLKFVSNLDKIMRNNQFTTIEDIKTIQKQYSLNLDYNISVEENNIFLNYYRKRNTMQQKKHINH